MLVLGQRPRVLCKAGREQVREQAGHNRGTQHVIKPLKSLLDQEGIDVKEEIVNVLHGEREIFEAEFERQGNCGVESSRVGSLAFDGH